MSLDISVKISPSKEDDHHHCDTCIKTYKCKRRKSREIKCPIVDCSLCCGFEFHRCKQADHLLICRNEMVIFSIFLLITTLIVKQSFCYELKREFKLVHKASHIIKPEEMRVQI